MNVCPFSANEKVLKMLKMAYDKLQILAGTSLPFFISFNTVLYAGTAHLVGTSFGER